MRDLFQITYQPAPKKRRRTLLVTADRVQAEDALRRARRALMIRWNNGQRVGVHEPQAVKL